MLEVKQFTKLRGEKHIGRETQEESDLGFGGDYPPSNGKLRGETALYVFSW